MALFVGKHYQGELKTTSPVLQRAGIKEGKVKGRAGGWSTVKRTFLTPLGLEQPPHERRKRAQRRMLDQAENCEKVCSSGMVSSTCTENIYGVGPEVLEESSHRGQNTSQFHQQSSHYVSQDQQMFLSVPSQIQGRHHDVLPPRFRGQSSNNYPRQYQYVQDARHAVSHNHLELTENYEDIHEDYPEDFNKCSRRPSLKFKRFQSSYF